MRRTIVTTLLVIVFGALAGGLSAVGPLASVIAAAVGILVIAWLWWVVGRNWRSWELYRARGRPPGRPRRAVPHPGRRPLRPDAAGGPAGGTHRADLRIGDGQAPHGVGINRRPDLRARSRRRPTVAGTKPARQARPRAAGFLSRRATMPPPVSADGRLAAVRTTSATSVRTTTAAGTTAAGTTATGTTAAGTTATGTGATAAAAAGTTASHHGRPGNPWSRPLLRTRRPHRANRIGQPGRAGQARQPARGRQRTRFAADQDFGSPPSSP